MKKLYDLLNMEIESKDKDDKPVMVSPEFRIAVQSKTDEEIHMIVHANGHNSDTVDLIVTGDGIRDLNEGNS